MKHCKHYLLFLLAGALLVLPVTYQYPISMDEVKKSVTQFFNFNEETLKKAIPATIIALVVASGLYYLWNNRGIAKPITVEIEGCQVTQFPVYSQFSSGGGGAASCGYHTLLRGMQLISGIVKGLPQKELKDLFMQNDAIIFYFNFENPLGVWREEIIKRRRIVTIAGLLKEKLRTALRESNLIENYDQKIADLYAAIINMDIKPELLEVFERGGSLGDYEFNAAELLQIFVKTDYVPEDQRYAVMIKDSNVINTYLDLDRVAHELSTMQLPTIKDSNNGDWLQGNELDFLWVEQEKIRQRGGGIISNDVHCGFTAIDNFEWIGMIVMGNVVDEHGQQLMDEQGKPIVTEQDLDKNIKLMHQRLRNEADLQRNYFHLFAMSTMQQSGDQSAQAGGHWFALVLYQHADGNREYFITDSMNVRRDNDSRVVKLIKAIEVHVEIRKEEI